MISPNPRFVIVDGFTSVTTEWARVYFIAFYIIGVLILLNLAGEPQLETSPNFAKAVIPIFLNSLIKNGVFDQILFFYPFLLHKTSTQNERLQTHDKMTSTYD